MDISFNLEGTVAEKKRILSTSLNVHAGPIDIDTDIKAY
jgi:hypothetical protein